MPYFQPQKPTLYQTALASGDAPMSEQDWFNANAEGIGHNSQGDFNANEYGKYVNTFMGDKYGQDLSKMAPVGNMQNQTGNILNEFESTLRSFNPGHNEVYASDQLSMRTPVSEDRIRQIMSGALAKNPHYGNILPAVTKQLNRNESTALRQHQNFQAPTDWRANLLQMGMSAGFGALTAPSMAASFGDTAAGFGGAGTSEATKGLGMFNPFKPNPASFGNALYQAPSTARG